MTNLISKNENQFSLKKEGNRLAANEANVNPNPPRIDPTRKKPASTKKPFVKLLRGPDGRLSDGSFPKAKQGDAKTNNPKPKNNVLSLAQLLAFIRQRDQKKFNRKKTQKLIEPLIPPKSLIIILKDSPQKAVYNERIINYKHCGLLQQYIGLGGKILPRRQTRLTAKQQRFVARTIKSARIMGLLPFVSKERSVFM